MRALIFLVASLLSFSALAANGPTFSIRPTGQASKQGLTTPGYCEIEVANRSHLSALVDIYYDDSPGYRNNYVQPGNSLFINLNYGGYCHARAYLVVSSSDSYLLYAKYTNVHQTVDITTGLQNKNKMTAKLNG